MNCFCSLGIIPFGRRMKRDSSRQSGAGSSHVSIKQEEQVAQANNGHIREHERPENDNDEISYSLCTSCDFSFGDEKERWTAPPSYSSHEGGNVTCSVVALEKQVIGSSTDVRTDIEAKLDALDPSLRALSLKIYDHPEIMWKEHYTHDILTAFMSSHGFTVTRHYLGLQTAWRAEYRHVSSTDSKTPPRTIGVNSEMDALLIGGEMMHACGHNLIAIAGCAVAIALRTALRRQDVSGNVILLGTPAEEGGGGKIVLLDKGAYDEMDACIMCHPGPGPPCSVDTGSTNAMQGFEVEYFGHAAHAGAAPWEGTNALDAAFLAYSAVSLLRQQLPPDYRVHGVVHGKNFVANVIPNYASMRWYIRAPTRADLIPFGTRVRACFQSAALATGCRVVIKDDPPYYELRQNNTLASEFSTIVGQRYQLKSFSVGNTASVDFGNVTYKLPAFHPAYSIPTAPRGGNHTPAFAQAARTQAAHEATMTVSKGLAITGWRVLVDDAFFQQVNKEFHAAAVIH